jgi:hypothetical protein
VAALVTSLAAVAALIGVKVQIDASARQQREQSAREIYREFLNLSVSKPAFADPDYCAISQSDEAGAYEHYVEYMLYTADQLLQASPAWNLTVQDHLLVHRDYLCEQTDWSNDTPEIQSLMARFEADQCRKVQPAC